MQRHAATLAAGLVVSAVAPSLYAQANRIAVVDLQRAVAETEDGRRALQRLERWTKQQQKRIDAAQEHVKVLKQTYDRQEGVWTPEHRAKKAAELQQEMGSLQTKYVELQRELAQRQARATQPILERMQRILRRIGQADGYALIVERTQAGVVWVPTNRDLTDDLIQRYNAGEGRDGATTARRRRPASRGASED